MQQVKIEKFEGPLSLLLELVEQEKLEITDVSLAQAAEQYLRIISARERQIAPGELADFLLVAAKLLLLKSRALLPELPETQDEDENNLAEQLKIYKIYRDAADDLGRLVASGNFAFYRAEQKYSLQPEFAPPSGLQADDLANELASIIKALKEGLAILEKKKISRVVSISERIEQLRRLLSQAGQVEFSKFLRSARNRAEIVVSFLALLELIKQKQIFTQVRNRDIYVIASQN